MIPALATISILDLVLPCPAAQFYGAVQTDGDDLREPMLVVEYCEGGDLRRALSLDGQTVRGPHVGDLGFRVYVHTEGWMCMGKAMRCLQPGWRDAGALIVREGCSTLACMLNGTPLVI